MCFACDMEAMWFAVMEARTNAAAAGEITEGQPDETAMNEAEPPANTFSVPETVVPRVSVPSTLPPDDTFSVPPLNTVWALSTVPATLKLPPLETPT